MKRIARRVAFAVAILSALPMLVLAQGAPVMSPATPAQATPVDTAKAALVRQLLEKVHATELALRALEAGLPAQRASNPRIPAVFWDRFLVQANARRGELADMIAAVYDHQFSTDEIRQLLAFYDTPLGQKLLRTLPSLMQESMKAGQEWGTRIGIEVATQLEAEGLRLAP